MKYFVLLKDTSMFMCVCIYINMSCKDVYYILLSEKTVILILIMMISLNCYIFLQCSLRRNCGTSFLFEIFLFLLIIHFILVTF